MTKKMKFMLALTVALCMMLGTAVFGTYDNVQPMTGEEIETGEGYQNIVPIMDGIQIEGELMPDDETEDLREGVYIPEEYRRDIEPIVEDYNDEEEEDEEHNMWVFIGAGAGIVVLIGIVIYLMKKQ